MNRWAIVSRPQSGLINHCLAEEPDPADRSPNQRLFPLFSFCGYNGPTCEQALHISNPLIANANWGLRSG